MVKGEEYSKSMDDIGIYPAITASIGGKQRRLTLSRQWRRAIEKGDLDRSTPIQYETGPGHASIIEASRSPELAALFNEIKGPSPLPETVVEQPPPTIVEKQKDLTVSAEAKIATAQTKRPTSRRSAHKIKPRPDVPANTIAKAPSENGVIDRSSLGWAMEPLRRYAVFAGRSRRREYWNFQLFLMLALLFFLAIAAATDNETMQIMFVFFCLGLVVPSLSLTVRRLHDRGLSGWLAVLFSLCSMIPVVGFLSALVFLILLTLPGTPGSNQYGPDPKG
jgi:uncharacterized membrane protein YhaH (DUF805 family)